MTARLRRALVRAALSVALAGVLGACADTCGTQSSASEKDLADAPPTTARSTASGIVDDAASNAPWSALPKDEATAHALILKSSARPPREVAAEDQTVTIQRIVSALEHGSAIVGLPAIDTFFARRVARAADAGKNAWVLFGTHHDSAGQIQAFSRLTGPLAPARFGFIVAEQFRADGRWGDVEPAAQQGDGAALARFSASGDPAALADLKRKQASDDYAAWKYDYVDDVLSVAVSARAAARPVLGCDMPSSVRAMLPAALAEDTVLRLRELHCALSLRAAMPDGAPHAVAMLWGEEHIAKRGFSRFIADGDEVTTVRIIGRRASPTEPDAAIEKRIVALDPVLVIDHDDAILLWPDEPYSNHVDRSRISDGAADVGVTVLEIDAVHETTAWIAGEKMSVTNQKRPVPVVSDAVTLVTERGGRLWVSALDVPSGARAEVHLEDNAPELRIILHVKKQ